MSGPLHERERRRRGLKTRREVLGREHVDRALRATTDFDRDFQDLITRYAWGEIWTRPGLPRKTRSLLTLAMLTALGRVEELKLHLRAARRNGVTPEQIRETLLQAAIYAGVPAAHAGFRAAVEVLAEAKPTRRTRKR
jgi:4-carboxymuconolactone decarboxylase